MTREETLPEVSHEGGTLLQEFFAGSERRAHRLPDGSMLIVVWTHAAGGWDIEDPADDVMTLEPAEVDRLRGLLASPPPATPVEGEAPECKRVCVLAVQGGDKEPREPGYCDLYEASEIGTPCAGLCHCDPRQSFDGICPRCGTHGNDGEACVRCGSPPLGEAAPPASVPPQGQVARETTLLSAERLAVIRAGVLNIYGASRAPEVIALLDHIEELHGLVATPPPATGTLREGLAGLVALLQSIRDCTSRADAGGCEECQDRARLALAEVDALRETESK